MLQTVAIAALPPTRRTHEASIEVSVEGFEPSTPCARGTCAAKLRYTLMLVHGPWSVVRRRNCAPSDSPIDSDVSDENGYDGPRTTDHRPRPLPVGLEPDTARLKGGYPGRLDDRSQCSRRESNPHPLAEDQIT